jgi:hypothetical protein
VRSVSQFAAELLAEAALFIEALRNPLVTSTRAFEVADREVVPTE